REPGVEVPRVPSNGLEAVHQCRQDGPDVVLMDLVRPVMDGVEATRRIMAEAPCAIVVVTVVVARHTARVFDAMAYGALDAADTPVVGGGDLRSAAAPLLGKNPNIGWLIGRYGNNRTALTPVVPDGAEGGPWQGLLVIGASGAGRGTVGQLLR
ncbi:response regulator, partial [Achromobacter xylosoxidans]|uniref:response regulator n=1 Tax=Alcaligenes xylosoxydans xylosoxydans TaxID=85698 RepID=UPI0037607C61